MLHHVATLLARHLGLRAYVARVAGRLRLVRLQGDVNFEMTGDGICQGWPEKDIGQTHFLGSNGASREERWGEQEDKNEQRIGLIKPLRHKIFQGRVKVWKQSE